MKPKVPVLVTHIKPEDRDEVIAELAKIGDRRIRILKQGETIEL